MLNALFNLININNFSEGAIQAELWDVCYKGAFTIRGNIGVRDSPSVNRAGK